MKILGIETSCDETAAAIIEADPKNKKVKLLSSNIASSLSLHAKTGGIIPEIAAREQIQYIIPVIKQTLEEAKISSGTRHSGKRSDSRIGFWASQNDNVDIDAIAVTYGPGLIGSLLVGVETAKTLAYVWNKPIIPVNHLLGHIYANFIDHNVSLQDHEMVKQSNPVIPSKVEGSSSKKIVTSVASGGPPRNDNIEFPALALIVSGGHTDLVLLINHGDIKWLGGTRDDAAGEAFDKIGRLLRLPYPGGPAIEKAAKHGNPKAFHFPRPLIDSDDFSTKGGTASGWDFSFSGLKTSVLNLVKHGKIPSSHSGESRSAGRLQNRFWTSQNDNINDICASVQQAIIDVLVKKTLRAAQKYNVKSILLGGGVVANQALRDRFELDARCYTLDAKLFAPPKSLCTDNAAMIVTAAFFNYKEIRWQKITANPELYF